MKINQLLTILFAIFLSLYGCSFQEGSNSFLRKWYYEIGNLKKVQEYSADSIENGTYLFYDEQSILIDSAQIKNGKFHGKRYLFRSSGSIHRIITYKNNVYRDETSYKLNGNKNKYGGYNYAKELTFLVEFDSLGRIKDYQGDPIYSWVMDKSYKVGDTVSIELLAPNIPGFKTKVVVEYFVGDAVKPEFRKEASPDEFNRVVYKKKRTNTDKLRIVNFAEIRDNNNEVVMTDTLTLKISETGETSY